MALCGSSMRKPWILTCGEQCAKHIPFADTRDWNIELAFDGVHFTAEGHHTFARSISDVVQSKEI